jgi:hypothetical protein
MHAENGESVVGKPTRALGCRTANVEVMKSGPAMRESRTVYLLLPGYNGSRPSIADGETFVHRAHATVHAQPFEATLIGEVPLPWHQDPADDARRKLASESDTVVLVGAKPSA